MDDVATRVEWPCFIFLPDGTAGGACASLREIGAFDEPLAWEELVAFDARFRRVTLHEPQRPGAVAPTIVGLAPEPEPEAFAGFARTAIRHGGPGARPRLLRRSVPSPLPTTDLGPEQLAALMREHLAAR